MVTFNMEISKNLAKKIQLYIYPGTWIAFFSILKAYWLLFLFY